MSDHTRYYLGEHLIVERDPEFDYILLKHRDHTEGFVLDAHDLMNLHEWIDENVQMRPVLR